MPLPDVYIPRWESPRNSRGRVPSAYIPPPRCLPLPSCGGRQSESDIVDIFHVGNAGVELVVDYDAHAQLDFDVDAFEVEAFDVWPATDGDEHTSASNYRSLGYILAARDT